MKKYFSALIIICRETMSKIFIVFALMIIAQLLLTIKLSKELFINNNNSAAISRFDIFLSNNTPIVIIFGIAFLIITGILICVPNYHFNKNRYTFENINISEKGIFFCKAFYNCCCYIMLIGIEIISIILTILLYYHNQNVISLDINTLTLSFYRNPFLHGLIPIWDLPIYLRNALLVLGLGTSTAIYTSKYRLDKANYLIFILVPLSFILFPANFNHYSFDIILAAISLFIIIRSNYLIIKEKIPALK